MRVRTSLPLGAAAEPGAVGTSYRDNRPIFRVSDAHASASSALVFFVEAPIYPLDNITDLLQNRWTQIDINASSI